MANNSKDTRIKFSANKYLIDQCLGIPGSNQDTSIREDKTITVELIDDINMEDMLAEIDRDIKRNNS